MTSIVNSTEEPWRHKPQGTDVTWCYASRTEKCTANIQLSRAFRKGTPQPEEEFCFSILQSSTSHICLTGITRSMSLSNNWPSAVFPHFTAKHSVSQTYTTCLQTTLKYISFPEISCNTTDVFLCFWRDDSVGSARH